MQKKVQKQPRSFLSLSVLIGAVAAGCGAIVGLTDLARIENCPYPLANALMIAWGYGLYGFVFGFLLGLVLNCVFRRGWWYKSTGEGQDTNKT